jgi:hypothetical protein
MTITPWNAAASNVFLALHRDHRTLDWNNKYHSEVTTLGKTMVSVYPCFTQHSEDDIANLGSLLMERMTALLAQWTK